ncbi:hypothetical protein [Bradyrhizobium sp. CCBAU 53351]|uniref:hypothetical protein n=1 Tax=Bradyrhizobium sp. CCBAU 53351 TaxID=1325114 RepID=UPI001AED5CCE|nr:hypothetical protein [Bradyrhizobium sp. CCBAU 53351]
MHEYFAGFSRPRQNLNSETIEHLARCNGMNIEKRALLDHAQRCRRVADDLAHREAAGRLRAMAEAYEARAARLDDGDEYSKPDHRGHGHLAGAGDRQN